ncbi:MAG: PilW family protein [Thiohalomonadaceae bacterium]
MLIGLILLAGVVQIFIGNRQTYRLQEASASVQESGRFASEFVTRDARMVGFMGCTNNITPVNNLDPGKHGAAAKLDDTVGLFNSAGALRGYSYDGTFPADLVTLGLTAAEVVQGTDIIVIQRAEACPGGDVVCHNNQSTGTKDCPGGSINAANYKIADNTTCNIQQNDVLLVTNCQTADIHGVTNNPNGSIHVTITHGANLNTSPKLSNSYGEGSAIYRMTASAYYVGFGASGEPALFKFQMQGTGFVAEELVEGVYDMDILYGLDTDNDKIANEYRTANTLNIAEWESVVAIRFTFRIRSTMDNALQTASSYTFNGAVVSDRRLRRDFTTTVAVRNRI